MTNLSLQPRAATLSLDLEQLGKDFEIATTTRRLLWGRRAIAGYLGKPDAWLRRQLERGKRPPPTFVVGSARVADADELDAWIEQQKARGRR